MNQEPQKGVLLRDLEQVEDGKSRGFHRPAANQVPLRLMNSSSVRETPASVQ